MAPLAASCRANNGVTCEWAPDGRHFLTATLAPRLRVDNGFQIFRWEVMLLCFANNEFAAGCAAWDQHSLLLDECLWMLGSRWEGWLPAASAAITPWLAIWATT